MLAAGLVPNSTPLSPARFVPEMTTEVPPEVGAGHRRNGGDLGCRNRIDGETLLDLRGRVEGVVPRLVGVEGAGARHQEGHDTRVVDARRAERGRVDRDHRREP